MPGGLPQQSSVAASGSESQNQRCLECRACKDGRHSHSCPATSPPCLDPAGDGRGAFAGSPGPSETVAPLQPSEGPSDAVPSQAKQGGGAANVSAPDIRCEGAGNPIAPCGCCSGGCPVPCVLCLSRSEGRSMPLSGRDIRTSARLVDARFGASVRGDIRRPSTLGLPLSLLALACRSLAFPGPCRQSCCPPRLRTGRSRGPKGQAKLSPRPGSPSPIGIRQALWDAGTAATHHRAMAGRWGQGQGEGGSARKDQ